MNKSHLLSKSTAIKNEWRRYRMIEKKESKLDRRERHSNRA